MSISADQIATRTNTDSPITWAGADQFLDSSAGLVEDIEFTTTTNAVDSQTRKQNRVIDREKRGDVSGGNFTKTLSYDLSGKVIEESL